MGEVKIRPMQKADVETVTCLDQQCFRSPWSENAFRAELKNKSANYLVMDMDGEIIGYAGMWVVFDEAHITNICIAPEKRNEGLGRKLMLALTELASSLDATSMTLEVRESNIAAQNLYYSLGFHYAGTRKRYYSDTGEDALILWNDHIGMHQNRREKGMKKLINAQNAPKALGPYNHAVSVNGMVFTSGQIGIDPETGKLRDGIEAQTKQVLKNIEAVLEAAGANMSDIVKTGVFVVDLKDFAIVNAIYQDAFGCDFPARSCVQVAALPAGALVEIEAIAVKSGA